MGAAAGYPRSDDRSYARPSRDWGWYSKYRSSDNTTHLLLGSDGVVTSDYPHLHVIYDDGNNDTIIVVSLASNRHIHKETLHKASGSDIDSAIEYALSILKDNL